MPQDKDRKPRDGGGDQQRDKEELALLRQSFNSMMMRGYYKECFSKIEENLRFLYFHERWPQNFCAVLRIHKRCYPSMDIAQSYDEYLEALLKKNEIPTIFVAKVRKVESAITWSSEVFQEKAGEAREDGNLDVALDYCELALKMDPFDSNAYLLRGWIHNDRGEYEQARESYEEAVDRKPNNYQAWFGLSALCSKTNPKKSLEHLERALEYAPDEARYHAIKAKLLLELGDRKGAMDSYHQASMLDPRNPKYPYERGEALLAENQTLAALRQYSQAVSCDRQHIPSLMRLAMLFRDTQPQLALPYITTVCRLQPENLEAAVLRADVLDMTGDAQEAFKQYQKVIMLDRGNTGALMALGRLSLKGDNPSGAMEYFRQAAETDPKNPGCRLGAAQALEALNRNDEALQEYRAAVALDKACGMAWGAMGLLLLDTKTDTALAYLEKAIALDGADEARFHQARGEALHKTSQKLQEVIGSFDEAVRCDPGNAELQLRLGQLLEETGNTTSAVAHYMQAVSLDVHLAEGFHGLARLLFRDRPVEALQHINNAIHLDATHGDFYYCKARVLETLAKDKAALPAAGDAYTKYADSAEMMEELARLQQGQCLRIALLYIDRAVELAPKDCAYLCLRARLLGRLGSPDRALEQYKEALKVDSGCHEALYGIGCILRQRNNKKALEYLDRAIALAPKEPDYHGTKAELLAREFATRGQALECYDKAIDLDLTRWDLVLSKARLLEAMNDIAGAQEHYRRVLLINRDQLEATVRMGRLLTRQGVSAGLGYLAHAIDLEPENWKHHAWHAGLLSILNREREARESFNRALELAEDRTAALYLLAKAMAERLPDKALSYLEQAMEQEDANPAFHLLLGEIQTKRGARESAKAAYRRVLELEENNHYAIASLGKLLLEERSPDCLEMIDRALALSPGNGQYLYIKATILATQDPGQALRYAVQAVAQEPNTLEYRELLVDLLARNKAPVKAFLERRRLERCRRLQDQNRQAVQNAGEMPQPAATLATVDMSGTPAKQKEPRHESPAPADDELAAMGQEILITMLSHPEEASEREAQALGKQEQEWQQDA